MPKREYSREFTARTDGKTYSMQGIPADLWRKVRAKSKREGVSLRAMLLRRLTEYLNEPAPGE